MSKQSLSSMDHYEKIRDLFKSGRYECDGFFYTELKQILEHLNLYEELPPVLENKEIVDQIDVLTKRHLHILENDDDQDAALKVIHEINTCVTKINPEGIQHAFEAIEKMGGKGYEKRVILLIKGQQYQQPYLEICERILGSIYDPVIRLQDILVTGVFVSKNGDKLNKFIDIFKTVLDNGVKELKKFRERRDFIESHDEVQQHPKVLAFFKGSTILLVKLLRFNEIYKIISGDSKFGLKINATKKEIQGASKEQQIKYLQFDYQRIKDKLRAGEPLHEVCSLCLQFSDHDHKDCLNTIRILYNQSAQQ